MFTIWNVDFFLSYRLVLVWFDFCTLFATSRNFNVNFSFFVDRSYRVTFSGLFLLPTTITLKRRCQCIPEHKPIECKMCTLQTHISIGFGQIAVEYWSVSLQNNNNYNKKKLLLFRVSGNHCRFCHLLSSFAQIIEAKLNFFYNVRSYFSLCLQSVCMKKINTIKIKSSSYKICNKN